MFADAPLDADLQDALLAHLAEDVRRGEATLEGVIIPGEVGVCLQSGLPTFTRARGGTDVLPRTTQGRTIELSYQHEGNQSWFDSQVVSAGPDGVWRLLRPSFVTTSTRRVVPRIRCGRGRALELLLDGPQGQERSLALNDLSTDGLGFLYDLDRTRFETGQHIEGWLRLPEQRALRVELGVVTISVFRPGSRLRRASTRFVSMRLEDRLQLASGLTAVTMQSWTGGTATAK